MFCDLLLERLRSLVKAKRVRPSRATPKQFSLGQYLLRGEKLEDRRLLSVTLLGHPTTSYFGHSVELAAKVAPPSGSIASGDSVTFWLGTPNAASSTVLGSTTKFHHNIAEIRTSALPVTSSGATDQIFAVYQPADGTGTSETSQPLSEVVNAAPTHIGILSSSKPAVTTTDTTITAVVSGGFGAFGCSTPDAPAGTLTFGINGAAAVDAFAAGTVDGKTIFTYTIPAGTLTDGDNTITATFTPTDTNYQTSTRTVDLKAVAPAAGSVSGSGTLRGGQRTFDLNSSGTPAGITEAADGSITATGPITYSDANYDRSTSTGLAFTSTSVASMVFNTNSNRTEISGVGDVTLTTGTSTTTIHDVNFTILASSGNGNYHSKPSFSIVLTSSATSEQGFDYSSFGFVQSGGSLDIAGTGTTGIPPLQFPGGRLHHFAVDSLFGQWSGHDWFGDYHAAFRI